MRLSAAKQWIAASSLALASQACAQARPEPTSERTVPIEADPPTLVPLPRQEPPHIAGIRDLAERADFERVRAYVATEDYGSARAIVADWRERYPDPQPWRDGYAWKNLEACLPRTDNESPIAIAILADTVGLSELALENYAAHIENGPENVWSSKANLCTYAVRCAIELDLPGRAQEFFDLALTLDRPAAGGTDNSVWKAQADAYDRLLEHPDDPRARVRFAVLFWEWSHPPYNSPIPATIAALQEVLDDTGEELDPLLRAEVYVRLMSLEHVSGAEERATYWARRLAREVKVHSLLAALPVQVAPWQETHDSRERRDEVLRIAADLLEKSGEFTAAATFLEPLLPSLPIPPPVLGRPADTGHHIADRLSILHEKAGDLHRALAAQLEARDRVSTTCLPHEYRVHVEEDEARIADLERRLDGR